MGKRKKSQAAGEATRRRPKLHGGLKAEVIDWNKVSWDVVLCHAPKHPGLVIAESLKPTLRTVEKVMFARPDVREAARAILDSWRFDPKKAMAV